MCKFTSGSLAPQQKMLGEIQLSFSRKVKKNIQLEVQLEVQLEAQLELESNSMLPNSRPHEHVRRVCILLFN
jgi:hypothetical protein